MIDLLDEQEEKKINANNFISITTRWKYLLDGLFRRIDITQECWEQYWISPGGNTQHSTNYMATCLQSRKLSKLDEPDCWRSWDELISDVFLWNPTYGRPARTYIQQLCEDTGCSPEDLPEAMNDWEKWRERVRDICANSTTWWWWWWSIMWKSEHSDEIKRDFFYAEALSVLLNIWTLPKRGEKTLDCYNKSM